MNNKQIRKFFINKENVECPLTEGLIESGYVQKSGGYIQRAKESGLKKPTQY